MKIAILSPLKQEEAETFIQNHISNLPFDKVIIYGGNFPYFAFNHLPNNALRLQFKLLQLFKKLLGFKKERFEAFQLARILKKEKVDVVFAEYLITGAETLAVLKKMKIPVVAIALGYDISVKHIIGQYKDKYQQLFEYASNIVIVSEHMKVNLHALNCPSNKIVYSPAAPNKSFFNIIPKFTGKQVLAVGRFVDKKAPHLTILAFHKVLEKVSDANLIMAGDGPLLNVCKDLVKVLNIEKSVSFIGRITPKQHIELLSESILFVQHSKVADSGDSEGTPVAILEASAAGLPVVSTLHAGIPNVVIDTKTGFLVPENDIELMAEKMIYLLQNKELLKTMGAKGKAFVKENFSLEKHIQIITDCIKKA